MLGSIADSEADHQILVSNPTFTRSAFVTRSTDGGSHKIRAFNYTFPDNGATNIRFIFAPLGSLVLATSLERASSPTNPLPQENASHGETGANGGFGAPESDIPRHSQGRHQLAGESTEGVAAVCIKVQ